MEAVYARFGRQLRRARKERKMTQAELAERVQLGRTSIVNIERGQQRVHLHTVVALAAALNVPPAQLLPEEPPETDAFPPELQTLPVAERDWVMRRLTPRSATPRKQRRRRGSPS